MQLAIRNYKVKSACDNNTYEVSYLWENYKDDNT